MNEERSEVGRVGAGVETLLTSFSTCGPSRPGFPACRPPCPGPPCPGPSWSLGGGGERSDFSVKVTRDLVTSCHQMTSPMTPISGASLETKHCVYGVLALMWRRGVPTLWIYHDVSVRKVGQPALLFLAKKAPDGGFDALLLRLFVEGVLAAGDAAQRARLCFQGGAHPGDTGGDTISPGAARMSVPEAPRGHLPSCVVVRGGGQRVRHSDGARRRRGGGLALDGGLVFTAILVHRRDLHRTRVGRAARHVTLWAQVTDRGKGLRRTFLRCFLRSLGCWATGKD